MVEIEKGARRSWRTGLMSREMDSRLGCVAAAVGLVTTVKLFVSWCVIGTNDAILWMDFADMIREVGFIQIYANMIYYNHPPLMSWLLAGLNAAEAATGWPYPFLVRLAPIFADAGSIFIIWALLQRRRHPHALALTLICCFNPVSFLISAYHGNTDPVFIFFILSAVLLAESRRTFWAGLAFGLSCAVKIVPVIFLPVFWFWLQDRRERSVFLRAGLVFPCIVFVPTLILAPVSLFHNVFQYAGIRGIWGIGHLLLEVFGAAGVLQKAPQVEVLVLACFFFAALPLFVFVQTLFAARVVGRRRADLIDGLFFVTVLFLVLTPGFGVQYLSWPVYFMILTLPALGTAWVFLAGAFLLRVYDFWGGLVPPYYADSYLMGQWGGWDRIFDLVLWALLLVLLSAFFKKKTINQREVS